MTWFLHDQARLAQERAAIDVLLGNVAWLQGSTWGIDGTQLYVDAAIEAHGQMYLVRMTYPTFFPASPPTVRPHADEGAAVWWSAHQFGPGGELCLEWGPDTWMPEVTGAQILESAHRLFEIEDPKGRKPEEPLVVARSRHILSDGQAMRRSVFRFLATTDLKTQLAALPATAQGELDFSILLGQAESLTGLVSALRPDDGEPWDDPGLPSRLLTSVAVKRQGLFARTALPEAAAAALDSFEHLDREVFGLDSLKKRLEAMREANSSSLFLLLQDRDGGLHAFHVGTDITSFFRYQVLELPAPQPEARLGNGVEGLVGKRVGIVGLGSAGSKIALSLARSGVMRFVLIDGDLFLPENLVRHALDWRNVGEHKAVAVATQLALVSPTIQTEVRCFRTTGQEATATAAGALELLAGCDLIIDATADAATFNQLAMIASQRRRAMVWLEVFGGGLGGLVARHRPGHDPDPFAMRQSFHAYTATVGVDAPPRAAGEYSALAQDGSTPLIASDADVAVIAHEAARLALDVLWERAPSAFPYSMYLIGLVRGWVFDQPFQNIPIDIGAPSPTVVPTPSEETVADNARFLLQLLKDDAGERADAR